MHIEEAAVLRGYRVINGEVFNAIMRKLKPSPCSKGYLRFNVRRFDGAWCTCWVHRFVAHQKFGQKLYLGKPDVRHLDGNKLNNLDENIALGTRSQNLRDTPADQRSARANRMNVTKHSKTWAAIDRCIAQGKTTKETAAIVGCSVSAAFKRSKKLKSNQ